MVTRQQARSFGKMIGSFRLQKVEARILYVPLKFTLTSPSICEGLSHVPARRVQVRPYLWILAEQFRRKYEARNLFIEEDAVLSSRNPCDMRPSELQGAKGYTQASC